MTVDNRGKLRGVAFVTEECSQFKPPRQDDERVNKIGLGCISLTPTITRREKRIESKVVEKNARRTKVSKGSKIESSKEDKLSDCSKIETLQKERTFSFGGEISKKNEFVIPVVSRNDQTLVVATFLEKLQRMEIKQKIYTSSEIDSIFRTNSESIKRTFYSLIQTDVSKEDIFRINGQIIPLPFLSEEASDDEKFIAFFELIISELGKALSIKSINSKNMAEMLCLIKKEETKEKALLLQKLSSLNYKEHRAFWLQAKIISDTKFSESFRTWVKRHLLKILIENTILQKNPEQLTETIILYYSVAQHFSFCAEKIFCFRIWQALSVNSFSLIAVEIMSSLFPKFFESTSTLTLHYAPAQLTKFDVHLEKNGQFLTTITKTFEINMKEGDKISVGTIDMQWSVQGSIYEWESSGHFVAKNLRFTKDADERTILKITEMMDLISQKDLNL